MSIKEDLNRLYQIWHDDPTDENFEPLYQAVVAKARIIVIAITSRRDKPLEHDLATDALMYVTRHGVPSGFKFSKWVSVQLRADCLDAVRAWMRRTERFKPLSAARREIVKEEPQARERLIALLPKLERRERRIVALLANGYTQAEVGRRLKIQQQRVSEAVQKLRDSAVKQPSVNDLSIEAPKDN